jgi:hypothetical protein
MHTFILFSCFLYFPFSFSCLHQIPKLSSNQPLSAAARVLENPDLAVFLCEFLSDDDDASPDNFSDCGIGRIPAESRSAGQDYVNKVKAYLSEQANSSSDASCIGDAQQSSYGPWRNKLIFVADDQDGSGGPG